MTQVRYLLVPVSPRRYLVVLQRTEGITGTGNWSWGDVLFGPDTYERCDDFVIERLRETTGGPLIEVQ